MTRLNKVALTISALLALVMAGVDHDLNKSEWASWVQAVGSIAAIAAGAMGIAWQGKQQRLLIARQPLEQETATVGEAMDLLQYTCDLFSDLQSWSGDDHLYSVRLIGMAGSEEHSEHAMQLYREFDVRLLRQARLKAVFFGARSAMQFIAGIEENGRRLAGNRRLTEETTRAHFSHYERELEFMRQRVDHFEQRLSELKKAMCELR